MPNIDALDAAILGENDGGQRQQLRTTMLAARQENPDEFARARQLSRETGLPAPVVARNLPEIQQRTELDRLDDLIVGAPRLAERMANDSEFAAVAHDNTASLAEMEALVNPQLAAGRIGGPAFERRPVIGPSQQPKPDVGSVAAGLGTSFVEGAERAKQGARMQFADVIGSPEMLDDATQRTRQSNFRDFLATPGFESRTAQGLYGGGASTLRNIPGLAASIFTRSPAPALASAGVQTELEAYGKYRARGATPGQAALGATGEGVVEVATEMIPLRTMLGAFGKPGSTAMREMALSQVQEQFGEQAATVLQDAIDTAVANPDKTWGQYLAERPDAAYQTFLATLVQSGVMTAAHTAVSRMSGQAQQAQDHADALTRLAQLAEADKVRGRDPESFQQFVAHAAEGGPLEAVWVNPNTLSQAGVDVEALAQASPSFAAQLNAAIESGGEVRIPTEEFATALPGTGLEQAVIPHLRTDPDAMTMTEAQTFMQGQAAEFAAEAKRLVNENEDTAAAQEDYDAVKSAVLEDLTTADRFTKDVNDLYAGLVANFYAARANEFTEAGTPRTAKDLFETYKLRTQAESVTGERTLSQNIPQTETPEFKNWFGASKVVDAEGKPLVVYHGTNADFADFSGDEVNYFTASSEAASAYAVGFGRPRFGARVVPSFVSVANPKVLPLTASAKITTKDIARLKAEGFDGVFGTQSEYVWGDKPAIATLPDGRRVTEVIPFLPEQIKSAIGNNGQFDPKNPNILAQNAFLPGAVTIASPSDFVPGKVKDILSKDGWAILTAENPNAQQLSADENAARVAQLKAELEERGIHYQEVKGKYGGNVENSVIVFGVDRWTASALGNKFGQESVLTRDGLLYADGTVNPATGVEEHVKAPEDFYSWLPQTGATFSVQIDFDQRVPVGSGFISYGRAALDSISVPAVHFSRERRTNLSSAYYGTGLAGAEAARLNESTDARIKRRLAFYVPEGSGVYPEQGVGAVAHGAMLHNLYDAEADPLRLWRDNAGLNDKESAVLNAGFAGYYARGSFGNQGTAVLLGTHTLQTTPIDGDVNSTLGSLSAPPAPPNATKEAAGKILQNRALPYGAQLASGWRKDMERAAPDLAAVVPWDALPTDRPLYRDDIARAVYSQATQTDAYAAARAQAEEMIAGQMPELVQQYLARFGNVIDADNAKRLFPLYEADHSLAAAVHEASSTLAKAVYTEALKTNGDAPVLLTAGGSGSGKSETLRREMDALAASRGSIVYDSTLSSFDSARARIDEALAAGASVSVVYTNRPIDLAGDYALRRPRVVPLVNVAKAHVGASNTIRQVAEHYAGNERVAVRVANNPGELADIYDGGLVDVPRYEYDEVERRLYAIAEHALAAGTIDEARFLGFVRQSSGRRSGALQSGEQGQDLGTVGRRVRSGAGQAVTRDRGQISFDTDLTRSPTFITVLQGADLSTYLHETGHFFLEMYADMAAREGTPDKIKADFGSILTWFGVTAEQWRAMSIDEKRPYHEQFARGFESYLFEGKSPTLETAGMFSRFRAWLLAVYKDIKALKVQLTDEVRGVFDRMLASEQQIKLTEQARAMAPMYATKPEGMTPADWEDYQAAASAGTEMAGDEMRARSLRNMQWLSRARSRNLKALQKAAEEQRKQVEAEVYKEVRQMPVYAAQHFLKSGVLPNGEKMADGFRLSIPALEEMYAGDGDRYALLDWKPLTTRRLAAAEGIHPDVVAGLIPGFTSGDHLVKELLAAEPEQSVVDGLTDRRMLERYGDMSDEKSIQRAADAAVHNEARARFVAIEYKALAQATGSVPVLMSAAREAARRVIAEKKIRELKPAQYSAAEARASKEATKAAAKDDIVAAATAKRNQLLNNAFAREAMDKAGEVEKAVRYLKKFDKEGTRKNIDIDYRDQIDAILERFDLRTGQSLRAIDKRVALSDWIKRQEDMGLTPAIDERVAEEAFRTHYKNLTVEQFKGVVDSIRNIEHLGRLKKQLLTAKDKREFAEVVRLISESVVDNAKRTIPEARMSDRGLLVETKRLFKNFLVDHRKFASQVRELDGWQDGGAAWEYLVRTMNEKGDFEAVEREKATIALGELLKPILKGEKLTKQMFFPGIGKSFTREERIGIALNMGNETNRERVLTGENLSPVQLQSVLDTLTKEEWDFVQGVWDYFDSFRPMMADKERRLTGVEPEWVQPLPVMTKHGTYRGGYYPIKADPLRSSRAEADVASEVQRQIERGLYTRATTRRGHLKARTESTGRPLRYDLGVVTEHVAQVVHDLAWHEWLVDANRLMRAAPIDGAVRDHYGPEVLRMMRDTLKDIAVGEVGAVSGGERILAHLRTGATIAGLGWRVTTSLLQPLGLTQSIVRIGSKWVAKGAAHWIGDTVRFENSAKKIYEKSAFMRLRGKTMQREINEIRNKVTGDDSLIEASYFYLIQKMQLVADIPTWWGAYEKAMHDENMTEDRAIALADQAVIDAQGAGQVKDLSAIQRGGQFQKLWTNFYSFFNTTFNLTREAVGRTNFRSPGSVALLAVDMALLYSIPALLGTVMKAALSGDWEDEDKLVRKLIADQINYLLGTVLVLREAGGVAGAVIDPQGGMNYTGPAGVRFFAELAKLGKQVGQGEADEAFWKALNSTFGILFHYPAGQINSTASGAVALAEERTDNPGALLVGAPRR